MKKVAIVLVLGAFLIVSCDKREQESQISNVSFTPCQQTKATKSELPGSVNVEFTNKGVQITHNNFEVTCDFTTVDVTHTFVNGVLKISQQCSPNEAKCICYTDLSYTINGLLQNEVNVIFINGVQVYCHNDNRNDNPNDPQNQWIVVENSTFGDNSIHCIVYDGNKFIAGGRSGRIASSVDGIKWTNVPNNAFRSTDAISCIACGNNAYVAGSTAINFDEDGYPYISPGRLACSTNSGNSWTAAAGTDYFFQTIAFGNNTFVAGGMDGFAVRSTDNGATWNANQVGVHFHCIEYGDNTFLAGSWSGTMIRSTDNGKTWTSIKNEIFNQNTIRGIAFGNKTFIAVGSLGEIFRSTDKGVTWTAITNTLLSRTDIKGISYVGNSFVAWSSWDTQIIRSTDNGVTWTAMPDYFIYMAGPNQLNDLEDIAFGANTFVAVGQSGNIAYLKINE